MTSKDGGKKTLGPGAYLLNEDDLVLAEAYAGRALDRVLKYDPKTSQRLLRNNSRAKRPGRNPRANTVPTGERAA